MTATSARLVALLFFLILFGVFLHELVKEMSTDVLEALRRIERRIEKLEEKVEEASKQTEDIHQFVPFVGWLSYAAASLPKRFLPGSAWQGAIKDQDSSSSSAG